MFLEGKSYAKCSNVIKIIVYGKGLYTEIDIMYREIDRWLVLLVLLPSHVIFFGGHLHHYSFVFAGSSVKRNAFGIHCLMSTQKSLSPKDEFEYLNPHFNSKEIYMVFPFSAQLLTQNDTANPAWGFAKLS